MMKKGVNTYKKKQMNHVKEPHKISSIKLPKKAAIIDNNANIISLI